MFRQFLLIILLGMVMFFPYPSFAQTNNDVTSKLENLGNPTKARWADNTSWVYARNVWDMQLYNNSIYLGSGDVNNNSGSGTNSTLGEKGSELWYFDTATNQFSRDMTVGAACGTHCIDDEHIDLFRVSGGDFFADGIDPVGSPVNGNFYRLEGSSWKEHTTLPNAVHVYEMAKFLDPTTSTYKLFVGVAAGPNAPVGSLTSGIQISSDNGLTWTNPVYTVAGYFNIFAARGFFDFNNKLYATSAVGGGYGNTAGNAMAQYTGGNTFAFVDASIGNQMFPGTDTSLKRVYKATHFNGHLVYLGATEINFVRVPISAYHMVEDGSSTISQAVSTAQKIVLPSNALARDILASSSVVYILASSGTSPTVTNYVYSSTDLTNWTEVLHFSSDTFARSFEYLNGDFYFGMGTETTPLSNTAGNILRFKKPNSALPGDIVANGKVDIYDYNQLLTDFGKTGTGILGDINPPGAPDGKVDIYDYNLLLSNFGKTVP